MIRYICDVCRREIDPNRETCYQVQIEISAAFDPTTEEPLDDRDHLEEIQDILESLEHLGDDAYESPHQVLKFHLCGTCRRRFVRNPLGGREAGKIIGFSKN